jgi:hypothetical protein
LYFEHCTTSGGPIKYYIGSGNWDLQVTDLIAEFCTNAAIWIPNPDSSGSVTAINVAVADPGVSPTGLSPTNIRLGKDGKAPAAYGLSPDAVVSIQSRVGIPQDVGFADVLTPATQLGSYARGWTGLHTTPSLHGQAAVWMGRMTAQHDAARRAFAPALIRFPNLVTQDSAEWVKKARMVPGSANVVTGEPGPDGSTNAATLTTDDPSGAKVELFHTNIDYSAGDWLIAGTWVRSVQKLATRSNQLRGPALLIALNCSQVSFDVIMCPSAFTGMPDRDAMKTPVLTATILCYQPLLGDGEWEWIYAAGRVATPPQTSSVVSCDTEFSIRCETENPIKVDSTESISVSRSFFAPVFLHIPSGTISNNEAAEVALHLMHWPETFPVGTVALLRDQDFGLQRHLLASGLKPSVSVEAAAGNGAGASIEGNDMAGIILLTTGQDPTAGRLAIVSFAGPFRGSTFSPRFQPTIQLTPQNVQAGANALGVYIDAVSDSAFGLACAAPPLPTTAYSWFYQVVGIDLSSVPSGPVPG